MGKTDLAVLDSRGRVVGNADIAHRALIGWYVAKNLLDDPKNPGWDVCRVQELARMFEQRAKDLKHFRRLGMVMTPLGWIRNVAFGSLVTVGFAYLSGASGAIVAKSVFFECSEGNHHRPETCLAYSSGCGYDDNGARAE